MDSRRSLSTRFQLLLLFLFFFLSQNSICLGVGTASEANTGNGVGQSSSKTSIVFTTLGRSRYTFDIFTLPAPPIPPNSSSSAYSQSTLDQNELLLTDGQSVNYNGFFPTDPSSLLSLLPTPPLPPDPQNPVEALVYVTERNGYSNIYLDIYPSPATTTRTGSSRRVALQIPARLQLPLLRPEGGGRVSMKDRPSISGDHLVYVSTHEASAAPRKSWAAVYSTHIATGETRRLTPHGIADFSPAVSPSGEWTAVASSGERGWTGEVQDLGTRIYVFRTRDGSERSEVVDRGGWPCWADDSTLYFHRESEDGWWSVYRATIRKNPLVVAVDRITPPGFHAFTPAVGSGFLAMATRRPTSLFRHIELLDLDHNVFVEVTRPISPDFHHFNPFVSPNSSRIGYHRCRGNSNYGSSSNPLMLESVKSPLSEISLFRIDGSFPSFSPDGDRIAFVGLPGLYIMNSDGSGKQEVLSGNAFPTAWDWRRKGVIYTSHGPEFATESTKVDVISITLPEEEEDGDGSSVLNSIKKLTIGGENNAFPSPSPDGKWVVFRSGRSGYKNLYIMDSIEGERAGLRRLTNGPWTDTMCVWSPDGEWIVFSSDRDDPGSGSFALYMIHPNGTGLRKVVQSGDGGRANHPSFSPDSKSIVFTSDYAAVSAEPISNPQSYQPYGEIFTAHIDGSEIRRLTHNSFEDGTPAWSPVYMKPGDVVESLPLCNFEDCHWLSQPTHLNFASAGSRCA